MVAHKTRSSRCSFRLIPDHPILTPDSWGVNPKEGKILNLIFLTAQGQTKNISLPLLGIFTNFMPILSPPTNVLNWLRGGSSVGVCPTSRTDSTTQVKLKFCGGTFKINCARQNCACKYTGKFFGVFSRLKCSTLPLSQQILTTQLGDFWFYIKQKHSV